MIRLWIDDVRPASAGYVWCKGADETKLFISQRVDSSDIKLIDIARDGEDYIKVLDWLEETGRSYPIHTHHSKWWPRGYNVAMIDNSEHRVELIDRTKLKYVWGYTDGGDYLLVTGKEIKNAPTIDPVYAAGVCYCRECIHRDGTVPGQPNIQCGNMHDDDFCSYGEKKIK